MCFRVFPAFREVGGIHEGGPTAASTSTQIAIAPFNFQICSLLKLPICLLLILSSMKQFIMPYPRSTKSRGCETGVAAILVCPYSYVRTRTTPHRGRVTLWYPHQSLGTLNDVQT
jgi:hypothetical protein